MTAYKLTNRVMLYEQVLNQIKNMIVQGVYQKGDLLPSEKELMNMMGVSRITVREALRLLNEAGVIETQKGKGSFVRMDGQSLIPKDDSAREYQIRFLHSTNVRLMLEPEIAKKVAEEASDEEIQELGKRLQNAREKDTFHLELVKMLHNPILEEWLSYMFRMETDPAVIALTPPGMQKRISNELVRQHDKIYEAICAHNGEFAYFYMKEHMSYVKENYEKYFAAFY